MIVGGCCDNPGVVFVREEPAKLLQENPIGNGRREYHRCLICGADHVMTFSEGGQLLDHKTYSVRTS